MWGHQGTNYQGRSEKGSAPSLPSLVWEPRGLISREYKKDYSSFVRGKWDGFEKIHYKEIRTTSSLPMGSISEQLANFVGS